MLKKYYRRTAAGDPYRPHPTLTIDISRDGVELGVLGNFVEVWLAKEGHDGVVGVNFLEKIQMATPSAVLGAVLADVDYVLMGAGIPREIPRLLTEFAAGRTGSPHDRRRRTPPPHRSARPPRLPRRRPARAAASRTSSPSSRSTVLAGYLYRDPEIRPDGLRRRGSRCRRPQRAAARQDECSTSRASPVYGAQDMADLAKIAALGLPFWLAGGYGTPDEVVEALAPAPRACSAARCSRWRTTRGSGDLRGTLARPARRGTLSVRNDPLASPTGLPVQGRPARRAPRRPRRATRRGERLCDLGYLRAPYERADGSVGYRCASEPVHVYVRKGGQSTTPRAASACATR